MTGVADRLRPPSRPRVTRRAVRVVRRSWRADDCGLAGAPGPWPRNLLAGLTPPPGRVVSCRVRAAQAHATDTGSPPSPPCNAADL
ncbi:hypothetical protein FRAAL2553 [Frankia alni ACN14a]|uniref:Uncharacterized protein n=1 Tax=Frankia alni (strain DSM 45986 / CECT 9034 / ACN14a) TaxID=326424 RepID=Q0RMP7_FRAAA|nr:hypothetical protein FRAAL2553 [Frankia alni ACN14a]